MCLDWTDYDGTDISAIDIDNDGMDISVIDIDIGGVDISFIAFINESIDAAGCGPGPRGASGRRR